MSALSPGSSPPPPLPPPLLPLLPCSSLSFFPLLPDLPWPFSLFFGGWGGVRGAFSFVIVLFLFISFVFLASPCLSTALNIEVFLVESVVSLDLFHVHYPYVKKQVS